MNRSIALVVSLSLLLLTACSSSSTPQSNADCFTGIYTVTFGTPQGDNCPALTAPVTWNYVLNHDGTVGGTVPKDSIPAASNKFDEHNCIASLSFTSPATDTGCTGDDVIAENLAFSSSGITGTWSFTGCSTTVSTDGGTGPIAQLACTYPITGTRH